MEHSVYDSLNYRLHEFSDFDGLDYESAVDATPRNYSVSFGNGTDGVSRMDSHYTVRTCDPYTLAAAAILDHFNSDTEQRWALKAMTVDGDAEDTISATIYDPPDDETEHEFTCPECEHTWTEGAREAYCLACHETRVECSDPEECWSSTNGAWMICEVFLADDQSPDAVAYNSLSAPFFAELLKIVKES